MTSKRDHTKDVNRFTNWLQDEKKLLLPQNRNLRSAAEFLTERLLPSPSAGSAQPQNTMAESTTSLGNRTACHRRVTMPRYSSKMIVPYLDRGGF
jgi:hypothetical protein